MPVENAPIPSAGKRAQFLVRIDSVRMSNRTQKIAIRQTVSVGMGLAQIDLREQSQRFVQTIAPFPTLQRSQSNAGTI